MKKAIIILSCVIFGFVGLFCVWYAVEGKDLKDEDEAVAQNLVPKFSIPIAEANLDPNKQDKQVNKIDAYKQAAIEDQMKFRKSEAENEQLKAKHISETFDKAFNGDDNREKVNRNDQISKSTPNAEASFVNEEKVEKKPATNYPRPIVIANNKKDRSTLQPTSTPVEHKSEIDMGTSLYSNGKNVSTPEVQQPLVNNETNEIIQASFYGAHDLLPGSPAKIRITENAMIYGKEIKKNTILTGYCQLKGDRLAVVITTLPEHFTEKVSLHVIDIDDRLEGLPLDRNAVRASANNSKGQVINQTVQSIGGTVGTLGRAGATVINAITTSKDQPVYVRDGFRTLVVPTLN